MIEGSARSYIPPKVASPVRISSVVWFTQEFVWRLSGRLRPGVGRLLGLLSARQHPEVMHQHAPSHPQFPMGETFAARSSTQKHILDNTDACFGLCPAALQPLEFPATVALLQKLG